MDSRRFLIATGCALALHGCATRPSPPAVPEPDFSPVAAPEPDPPAEQIPSAVEPVPPPPPEAELEVGAPPVAVPPRQRGPVGRRAIAAANADARVASSADAFVGGVQLFAWEPGRVYEIWTAPLRVTTLTLAPGETVVSKAAGDTVRWQIGESTSGEGLSGRTHVLIKPIQTGLETNLVLTTNRRVYLLQLRSGAADAFNTAVAWDFGALDAAPPPTPPEPVPVLSPEIVAPAGPIDTAYRILPRGRAPRWTPRSVFNDGARTFIVLSADAATSETPAVFVVTDGRSELVNYRQSGDMIVIDRLFDEAELRVGDRRPQVVRLLRQRRPQ